MLERERGKEETHDLEKLFVDLRVGGLVQSGRSKKFPDSQPQFFSDMTPLILKDWLLTTKLTARALSGPEFTTQYFMY
jgi:hypothetical protein